MQSAAKTGDKNLSFSEKARAKRKKETERRIWISSVRKTTFEEIRVRRKKAERYISSSFFAQKEKNKATPMQTSKRKAIVTGLSKPPKVMLSIASTANDAREYLFFLIRFLIFIF